MFFFRLLPAVPELSNATSAVEHSGYKKLKYTDDGFMNVRSG